jgi:lysophospholipase L1-like esterase
LAIQNLARDGARFEALPGQIRAAAAPASGFDVILVSAGGNDVIRGSDADEMTAALDDSFSAARQRLAEGGLLLVQPAGNVGNSPFFPLPFSGLMNERAEVMHQAVHSAAARHDAVLIDMAREKENDPFVQNKALNASDGLHPSDAGYRVWRDELLAQSGLKSKLAPAQ